MSESQPTGDEVPVEQAAEVPFEEVDPDALLPGPDRLDTTDASRLLAQGPGRLIVWMGERDSGKTTLTTSLYERQRRAGEDTRFAGSRTLLALERLAHPRRAASGRSVSETHRTELDPDGREILHLALTVEEKRIHLLLADLPGEVFRQLADNQLSAFDIPLLPRADKLALLIDGGRLREPGTRATVLTRARQLLERLQADALPHPRTELALLVTKWDRVAHDESTMSYWQTREPELLSDVRALDPGAPHLHVAAGAPEGHQGDSGVRALRSWLLAPPRGQTDPSLPTPYPWPADAPARLRRPWRRPA